MEKRMRIKLNWGTGIFIFLGVFVITLISFVIFTLQFNVNLVHKDYYEKGVDHSEQMKTNQRSAVYMKNFKVASSDDVVQIQINKLLAAKIDSGSIHIYRPSDSRKDIFLSMDKRSNLELSREQFVKGRYIFKFHWYSSGIKYQVDKSVYIQ